MKFKSENEYNFSVQKKNRSIAKALEGVPKYRNVCPDTLKWAAEWASVRHKSEKEAIKAARRKLHQIYGAYFRSNWARHLKGQLKALQFQKNPDAFKTICLNILKTHSSTAERIPLMDAVYRDLLAHIPSPKTLMDLACGFHPFAMPWMGELEAADYTAVDIDRQLLGFIGDFARAANRHIGIEYRDILISPPRAPVDVVLLLKTIPLLERIEKNAALRLLRLLNARYVIISFPLQTLGGNRKGLEHTYRETAGILFTELGVEAVELAYDTEIFYIYEKKN
jgi:16S rRNA (guanine(1405)-N(7))-methyltransferase